MFKKIVYTAFLMVTFPLVALAQHEDSIHQGESINTFLQDHWHDIPAMIFFVLAAIFAYRIAFLYGGIIGKALNLISAGLLIIAISDVVGNFLLHLIDAEESVLHYSVDFMQIIGAGCITFAFLRLYAQTKQQFALSQKK